MGFTPANAGKYGIIKVDNSNNPVVGNGAVYKGLAIATNSAGTTTLLYATNFRAGTVEVYDTTFARVIIPGAFTDPDLPRGLCPVQHRPHCGQAVRDVCRAGCGEA